MKVSFTVLGTPQGKGRPRFTKVGKYVRTYTPNETVSYENLVKIEYRRQCKDYRFDEGVPLDVRIIAYYDIPKSASKKKRQQMIAHQLRPMKKPDNDNIIKCVLDALNQIAYKDDVQVADCQIRKFYSENPRIVVTIAESLPIAKKEDKNGERIKI